MTKNEIIARACELEDIYLEAYEQAVGHHKYGAYWAKYGENPAYEDKLHAGEIVRPELTDEENLIVIKHIQKALDTMREILDLFEGYDCKERTRYYKMILQFFLEVGQYDYARHTCKVAKETAHGRSYFTKILKDIEGLANKTGDRIAVNLIRASGLEC